MRTRGSGRLVCTCGGSATACQTNPLTALEAGYYEPYTRVEVQTQPVGFGSDWNFEARIERVVHAISVDRWEAQVRVFPHDTTWEQTDSGRFR